jgi:tape measure domain-containing protein
MPPAERSMSVKLSLVVGDYVKGADQAARATRGIATAANAVSGSQKALNELRKTGAQLATTMGAVGAVGIGTLAGMTTQAISAGVAYNSLQQTAGSALETLLGSAEAATAQMEELAAFAKTSPFPRQLWIQAQQTLIGFGVEAEKVVPIFQALQDGVVAVGGSAQQIEEVILILAKLSSTGKLTGEDLNQLAERGIDAATLVGDAWGLTAADIRESISAGTVDATEFMDTLVAQLGIRYAGAAEGLRETWVGALDRVKGATRDVGAAIAEPFIDPQGGGAAVEWANEMADALRAFESILKPAIAVLRERAEPAFQSAAQAMDRFGEAVKDVDIIAILDSLEGAAPILIGFGAAAAAAGSASALSAIGMGGLGAAISPVAAGILGLATASPAFRDALMDMLAAIAPLLPALVKLGVQIGEGLTLAIDSLMPFVEVAIGLVGGMISMFAALPEPIQQAAIAIGVFAFALKKLGLVGIILTGIGYIATAVSTISDSSAEASIDVNTLAQDLKDFQLLGRTFKLQETDISGVTGPIQSALDKIEEFESEHDGIRSGLSETFTATEDLVGITQEWVDEQGNLNHVFRTGSQDSQAFISAVDTLDKAMVELVAGGMDAEDALALVAEVYGLSSRELELLLPLLDEYNVEADRQGEVNQQAADEQAAFAEQVGISVAALQELAAELRAQVDPVFAAVRAMQGYEQAQRDYNDAVEEHGAGSAEAVEAEMALVEAYLTAADAAGAMAKATGGELPPELIAAAEAAGLGEEAIALLEEQFYNTRDAGQEMGEDLANVNADLSTETGRMAAKNGLELAGMEAEYASLVLSWKRSVDALMGSGMTYAEAIAFVAQDSGVATSDIAAGFGAARDAGMEFSDAYPAEIYLEGYDKTRQQLKSLGQAIHDVPSYKRVVIEYSQQGLNAPSGEQEFATGGRVLGGSRSQGDVVHAWLTPEEHVLTPEEVDAMGGHAGVEAMRAAALAGKTMFAQSGSYMPSMAAASVGAMEMFATIPVDLGEGISQVVRVKLQSHDRDLRRAVMSGRGAAR